jgi:hypothetical protein
MNRLITSTAIPARAVKIEALAKMSSASSARSAANVWITSRRTLRRRSQKDGLTRDRMTKLADHWLPLFNEHHLRGLLSK